jgi:ATP-dependent Clp protease ATP-binding subunit ClpB
MEPQVESSLKQYTHNLTERAKERKLDPVIGRDSEIRRMMQILARRTKNNPVLVGDPGVGKTALVEGLANRIVAGDVPDSLKHKELLVLDLASILAGSAYRGEFEKRIKSILTEIDKSLGKYLLFIDEMHTLVGAGGGEGAVDAGNILKPALARGELHLIGATTIDEYRKYIEKDSALERRFQPIQVDEPSSEDTLAILRGIKEKYEIHHGLRISDDALVSAVNLSTRYIADRYLPDKAIDLIDESASALKIEIESMPTSLDTIKRRITQIEIELASLKKETSQTATDRRDLLTQELEVKRGESARLERLWQDQKSLVEKINHIQTDIDNQKSLLDKAETEFDLEKAAQIKYDTIPKIQQDLATAQEKWQMIPDQDRVLQIEVTEDDVARVVSKWTGIPVTKLVSSDIDKLTHLEDHLSDRVIGQPQAVEAVSRAIRRSRSGISSDNKPVATFMFLGPTGVGKTETAKALAETLFGDEKSLIRIDMTEYTESHSVARLVGAPPGYVGYEEGGQLTEAVRRRPFSIVLFDEIEKAHPQVFSIFLQMLDDGRLTDGQGRQVSFLNTIIIMTSNLGSQFQIDDKMDDRDIESQTYDQLKQHFRPEFINRLDQIITFKKLNKDMVGQIVSKELQSLTNRLVSRGYKIEFDKSVHDYISLYGFDPVYGARPIKRLIQSKVEDEIAMKIIESSIKISDKYKMSIDHSGSIDIAKL